MTDYPAVLAELWAQHKAPRADDAPTFVSLFSGCGGSSLGYTASGYAELLAVERDRAACQVFRRNHPGVKVYQGDVTTMDPGELDLPPSELDLLDSSPPCVAYSMAGLRRRDDPRGQLWREVVRLASAWRPKVIVLENVKGLVTGSMRAVFSAICGGLRDAGYQVAARLVDAQYLGVPQARQRVFIVATRDDLASPPVFPVPVTRPLTVRDALADLSSPGAYLVPEGKGARLAPLVEPGRTGLDALRRRGGKPAHFSCVRLSWDRPANTLVREVRPATGSGFLHPSEPRFIGIRELTRIQSIPDEYDWCGLPYRDVHHLVGNSVPPLVAGAVGLALLPLLAPGRVPG